MDEVDEADARRRTAALLAVWTAMRAVLVLCVLRVLVLPGPDVGSDVAQIEKTGGRALLESIGILGTCIREAPEFASRKRHNKKV